MKRNIANIRKEYGQQEFDEANIISNPFEQFEVWLQDAIKRDVLEPTAMTLATSTFEGKPSARVVLLKSVSEDGFGFFTNYESRKAKNILQNPYGALVFYWAELERQVRIEGKIQKVSERDSDTYFKTRPEGSKIGAWASPQSQVVPNRRYLDDLMVDFKEEFRDKPIKRPKNWGGYILSPTLIEFWQGRKNRLHDRMQYRLDNGIWTIERLAP